jgi:hypothetical protein
LEGVLVFAHIRFMEHASLFTRRKALGFVAAGIAAPSLIASAFAATSPVLVELFTSQGCSSCPAADHLAGLLMAQPNIFVVSLNVDYWDYLGWKDTLAKPEYTKRQMDYAHSRGDMDVYTPQMVINGASHVVGSNQSSVEAAIATARHSAAAAVLSVSTSEKNYKITMPANASAEATLWLISIDASVDVKIERGENAGKSIKYSNVARQLTKIAAWNGFDRVITLPRTGVLAKNIGSSILVLQSGQVGPVLGLGKLG